MKKVGYGHVDESIFVMINFYTQLSEPFVELSMPDHILANDLIQDSDRSNWSNTSSPGPVPARRCRARRDGRGKFGAERPDKKNIFLVIPIKHVNKLFPYAYSKET